MASDIAVAVIEKIGGMALEQASMVVDFTEDFQLLRQELTKIGGGLKYADSHTIHDERARRWIQQLRDVAWDTEDIIEECVVENVYSNSAQSSCVSSYMEIIFQLIFRYNMGRRIKDVRQRMMSIIQDARDIKSVDDLIHLGEPSTSRSETLQQVRKPLSRPDSTLPHVALEDKVNHILQLLQNPEFSVIAVVGMGGVGKTFLLQHVYRSAKQSFAKSIWLSISQNYSVARLQRDVASQIREWQADLPANIHIEEVVSGCVSEERAADIIFRCLENAEALIVLDDVWRVNREDVLIERLGLSRSRCKILVSTRNKQVGEMMGAHVYEMKTLLEEDSWKLFCSYAFANLSGKKPPKDLESLARAVERKCGNLPLAIKTVAASMAKKTLTTEWESKLRQLKKVSILPDSTDAIMSILRLSYDSLPVHLKPCFQYLAFFGEDENIDPEYLVSCWIAEGFVPEEGPEVEGQWDLAFNYLYQLYTLCLVQVEETKYLYKYCIVHDLVLDLAISICKENNCAVAVQEACPRNSSADGSSSECRRILLANKGIDNNAIANLHCPRFLRTLSLSNNEIENIPANLFSSVRALRVLDLSHTKISTLPKCFGNFKLLRVLNLFRTRVQKVPECVRNLKSLCFLDLGGCPIERLPTWIGELKCLQYLDVYSSRLPKEISNLVSLRTLKSYPLGLSEDEFLKLKDVAKLINLQCLKIKLRHQVELKSMEEGVLAQLVNMGHLEIVNGLSMQGADNLPCFPENMKAMKHLESLYLEKFVVPSWMCEFASLRVLWLNNCELSDDAALEAMPNLMTLSLQSMKKKEILKAFGKSEGIPKLRFLSFYSCNDLEELPELKDGAIAGLEELTITECKNLQKVREGLQHLKNLKLLQLRYSGTNKLKERLKEDGEDWKKLKANNPSLTITVRQ